MKDQVEMMSCNNNQINMLMRTFEKQANKLNKKWILNPTMLQNMEIVRINFNWEKLKLMDI